MLYFCALNLVKTLHIHCISVSNLFNGCITINSVFLCTASRDNITKILHCDAPYTQSLHHSTSCISVPIIYWKRYTNTVFLCPMYSVVAALQMLFFWAHHSVMALKIQHFCVQSIEMLHHNNALFLCIACSNDITKYCISVSMVLNGIASSETLQKYCISKSVMFNHRTTIQVVFLCIISSENITHILCPMYSMVASQ